tara:strand:+ start:710 stop:1420 length:711 start_codon:yes stop_codon:yes gene_type:complete
MSKKIVFADEKNVFVISKSKTSNKKISDGKPLVQTYTFSRDQYNLATTSKGFGMKKFFALDGANCMDCKFSGNQGSGGCYTHKFNQYVGFLSMLRSIKIEQLTPITNSKVVEIVDLSRDTYVRFGTYGEPSLFPLELIEEMTDVASNWTGYTHQHDKEFAQGYKDFFMASTHTDEEANQRSEDGWRSFIALELGSDANAISCPASKEAGFVTNCAKCSLCSGAKGKGKKNVKILLH